MMVEGGANIVPEDEVLAALMFGHDKIKEIINLQNQLVTDEITKREFTVKEKDNNKIKIRFFILFVFFKH